MHSSWNEATWINNVHFELQLQLRGCLNRDHVFGVCLMVVHYFSKTPWTSDTQLPPGGPQICLVSVRQCGSPNAHQDGRTGNDAVGQMSQEQLLLGLQRSQGLWALPTSQSEELLPGVSWGCHCFPTQDTWHHLSGHLECHKEHIPFCKHQASMLLLWEFQLERIYFIWILNSLFWIGTKIIFEMSKLQNGNSRFHPVLSSTAAWLEGGISVVLL